MRSLLLRLLVPLLALGAVACSSLPPPEEREPSTYLEGRTDSRLGRALARAPADPADGLGGRSGIVPLQAPLDAFAARLVLVRSAERALDLQYYIWRPDITGLTLLEEVRKAAERGVRVRLLLDDNGIAGLDSHLLWLDSLAGIEVRVFNAFPNRRIKFLGYLTDFDRLNRRMHNKALIADAQAAIVGGRNIGDAYFGADPGVDFSDLDVLAAGPIARDLSQAFDTYWNSPLARRISTLAGPVPADAPARWKQGLEPLAESPLAIAYASALRESPLSQGLSQGRLAMEWVPVRLLVDSPDKLAGRSDDADLLAVRMGRVLGPPRQSMDLVSPYFVPGDVGAEALTRYTRQGLDVRILTNSLAATDVAAVHAGYARHRVALLEAGVRLYELKPGPLTDATRAKWRLGSSAASLHGKTFSIDRDRAFVGSFNLDPRSLWLNTELGLVIESPRLAGAISDSLDRDLATSAYELRLDAGGRIEWVERTPQGEVVHASEPGAGLWRRMWVWLLSRLPIESLL